MPTTTSTSTCKTPGWLGCNDRTTTMTTSDGGSAMRKAIEAVATKTMS